jgi:hypothetical protein
MPNLKFAFTVNHLSFLLVQPDDMGVFGPVVNVLEEFFHGLFVTLGLPLNLSP